jgi:hypothetical protein
MISEVKKALASVNRMSAKMFFCIKNAIKNVLFVTRLTLKRSYGG